MPRTVRPDLPKERKKERPSPGRSRPLTENQVKRIRDSIARMNRATGGHVFINVNRFSDNPKALLELIQKQIRVNAASKPFLDQIQKIIAE